jgi:flagellar motor switch protein FliN/FliY
MSDAMDRRLRALGEELAAAVADAVGMPITVAPAAAPHQAAWRVTLAATGEPTGRLVVTLDGAGTRHLSDRILGAQASGDAGADEAHLLREVLSRAAAAMAGRDVAERLALVVETVDAASSTDGSPGEAAALEFVLAGLEAPIPVALAWTHAAVADAATGRGKAAGAAATGRLDVILDIDLPVVVRFGCTQMPIRALSRLGPGSVIELGRSPDDPVEVLVSNRVVARGEVVIVGGNYGVRILDVTSQSERVRSMEG